MAQTREITWDPEADRRIKRSPFLMRRFIRKRIEDRVASRGRTHVTEADVDESASMYRQYRFKLVSGHRILVAGWGGFETRPPPPSKPTNRRGGSRNAHAT